MTLAAQPEAFLQVHVDPVEREYTGRELCSHFIFRTYGLAGDSAVAFVGPCHVEAGDLVDLEDARDQAPIHSPRMLHFLIEHFQTDLEKAVYRQRLLIVLTAENLRRLVGLPDLVRRGDDLFVGSRKLTVSIATASAVSTLIHVGINVRTEGTPVPTAGLAEWEIDPPALARAVLADYQRELAGIYASRVKVRPVP